MWVFSSAAFIYNGNRTEQSPDRSVIIPARVIDKSGSPIRFITSMITYRIGGHEVLLPINHNYNKICDILGFLKLRQKKLREFFLLAVKTAIQVRAYCPVT